MAKVTFKAMGKTWETEVEVGKSLLELARDAHAPEGDACGGVCACSTCHVYVEQGDDLLSEAEEDEEDILDKAFDVQMDGSTYSLGCHFVSFSFSFTLVIFFWGEPGFGDPYNLVCGLP